MTDVKTPSPPGFEPVDPQPPRTLTVVLLLVAAALIFSYLWAYAMTNVLVAAELMTRWPPGRDPRPMRLCIGFVTMMSLFSASAIFAQWMSRRQLRRIDEMENAEDSMIESSDHWEE
ncbi:MAG TPA: hypothetical protein VHS31_02930 [Tepidisphaeraceae bacterium]|jgi:hypothetical protein|nr:hypothetical protein [Tepidisphaeraceae bacterium]